MSHQATLDTLLTRFPEAGIERQEGLDFTIVLPSSLIVDACRTLRDDLGFDFLSNLTAVDRPDAFEVVYHLYSLSNPAPPLALKVRLADKADPRLASVTSVWEGANLQEREVYDLFGIVFEGHPKLERILLWEGFPGHPLRKDFINRIYSFEEMRATLPPETAR